jgi:hypothetical protein
MNSLEFPLYFFLFVSKGLEQGRKLNLVGEKVDISHALRLLRITLFGPTRDELEGWQPAKSLPLKTNTVRSFLSKTSLISCHSKTVG